MIGTLYGVGVGPGNPKYLTLEAVDILKKAHKIAVPDAGGENTALAIVSEFIEGKDLVYCNMPMTKDKLILDESHRKCAEDICALLDEGYDIAFITLGDPTIYSTYMYVHRIISDKGYKTVIVSGITSFCAAAAALNISLCDGKEALHIIPASYENLEEMLGVSGNKVLMKSGRSIMEVKEILINNNLSRYTKMVERCSMENQKIHETIEDIDESSSYFSIFIVK